MKQQISFGILSEDSRSVRFERNLDASMYRLCDFDCNNTGKAKDECPLDFDLALPGQASCNYDPWTSSPYFRKNNMISMHTLTIKDQNSRMPYAVSLADSCDATYKQCKTTMVLYISTLWSGIKPFVSEKGIQRTKLSHLY